LLLGYILLEYLFPSFYPEKMSIHDVEVCFRDAAEGWILFSHPFCSFVSFYPGIEKKMMSKHIKCLRCSFLFVVVVGGVSVCVSVCVCVCVCVCVFPPLIYKSRIIYSCVFLGVINLLTLEFSFWYFLQA